MTGVGCRCARVARRVHACCFLPRSAQIFQRMGRAPRPSSDPTISTAIAGENLSGVAEGHLLVSAVMTRRALDQPRAAESDAASPLLVGHSLSLPGGLPSDAKPSSGSVVAVRQYRRTVHRRSSCTLNYWRRTGPSELASIHRAELSGGLSPGGTGCPSVIRALTGRCSALPGGGSNENALCSADCIWNGPRI